MNETFWERYSIPLDNPGLPANRRGLYRLVAACINYIPWLLFFNFIGFVLVYIFAYYNLLDDANNELLIVGFTSFVAAILHLPLIPWVKQNRLEWALICIVLINNLASVVQVFLWKDIDFFIIALIAVPTLLVILPSWLSQSQRIGLLMVGGIFLFAGLVLDLGLQYPRLTISSLSSLAGLIVYVMMSLLILFLIGIISRIQFGSIASRMSATITTIIVISAIITVGITLLVNQHQNRKVSNEQQVALINSRMQFLSGQLNELRLDSISFLRDENSLYRINYLLTGKKENLIYQFNYQLVYEALKNLNRQFPNYSEMLLLDETGTVLVSTQKSSEAQNLSKEKFYQRGIDGQVFTVRDNQIVIFEPINVEGRFRGAFITYAPMEPIQAGIAESYTPFSEAKMENYLVGSDYKAISPTQKGKDIQVRTQATERAFKFHNTSSQVEQYTNYDGDLVYGYYVYVPELDAVLINEVRTSELTSSLLRIFVTHLSIGIFAVLMAFVIIYINTKAITYPVIELTNKANELARGNLNVRIEIDQQDEIGNMANTFNIVASEFQTIIETLESQITERTDALQMQTNRMRMAAEIARDAINTNDLDELLNNAAGMILERFNFYHTGIFMIDQVGEYAVLRASPTAPGKMMLERNHRLRIGQIGIVGHVAATGQPRIALDTSKDEVHFQNPLLPATRSEMALPLKVNNEVIGVLDVQSEKPDAFDQDDIASLQIMADQLALAVQRTMLTEDLENNLQELEHAYQRFTLNSWKSFVASESRNAGYRFDGTNLLGLSQLSPDSAKAIRQGKSVISPITDVVAGDSGAKMSLTVPVRLREQVIGAMNLNLTTEHISQETIRLAEEIANRLAIALDNARLYTETQQQAQLERVAGDIANKIGASVNIENILRTSVQEFGKIIPGAEVTIRLNKGQEDA